MIKQGNNNLPEFSIIYIVKFRIELRFDDKVREFSVQVIELDLRQVKEEKTRYRLNHLHDNKFANQRIQIDSIDHLIEIQNLHVIMYNIHQLIFGKYAEDVEEEFLRK
jgi:hypothetical protein